MPYGRSSPISHLISKYKVISWSNHLQHKWDDVGYYNVEYDNHFVRNGDPTYELQNVRVLCTGNKSTKYLNQLQSYSNGQFETNKPNS